MNAAAITSGLKVIVNRKCQLYDRTIGILCRYGVPMANPYQKPLFGALKRPFDMEAYTKRKCAHPGCDAPPSFGYWTPFCHIEAWTCREHRVWFEAGAREDQ